MISFHCILDLHRGNLMFADDCPTKRAAFMTDMTLGRWSHVPAFSTSFLAELHLPCLTTRLSQEPACRISTSLLQFGFFLVRLSGYGDGNLSSFSGLFIDPFLSVRCNGSVFARQMHSTTEFAMTILSKCVGRVCWSFDLAR